MSVSDPYAAKSKSSKKVEAPKPEETQIEDTNAARQVEESESTTTEEVPTGTVDEVLEWVGDDKDRAALALEAEKSGKNRKSLISELEELV